MTEKSFCKKKKFCLRHKIKISFHHRKKLRTEKKKLPGKNKNVSATEEEKNSVTETESWCQDINRKTPKGKESNTVSLLRVTF